HGPRGRWWFPGRGARPAALPHLRTLRLQAAPAQGARATVAWGLRPPRIEDIRLVGARARPAVASLRRTHERPARRAARGPSERARRALKGAARGLPTSVSSSDAKYIFGLEGGSIHRPIRHLQPRRLPPTAESGSGHLLTSQAACGG